ncbi:MAG: hypothetical protein HXY25_08220, partial [Alphaproteobacteria bacterium]|nr:hypothetical protein [Alphaproteobacteria bacterium]
MSRPIVLARRIAVLAVLGVPLAGCYTASGPYDRPGYDRPGRSYYYDAYGRRIECYSSYDCTRARDGGLTVIIVPNRDDDRDKGRDKDRDKDRDWDPRKDWDPKTGWDGRRGEGGRPGDGRSGDGRDPRGRDGRDGGRPEMREPDRDQDRERERERER